MFERFTERARQVVVLAQDEARKLGHNYIGTEHILLGLLREEEGIAARVLESLDVDVDEARARVAQLVGPGEELTTGQIPFTPHAKKVLELSLREALSLGHNYIGTEHVLLGLVRVNEGLAAQVLLDFGADPDKIRNQIIRMLSGPGRRVQEAPSFEPPFMPELADEVELIREEMEMAISGMDFERAASLRAQMRALMRSGGEVEQVISVPSGKRIPVRAVVVGWLLFAVALGVGLFVGWLIWG